MNLHQLTKQATRKVENPDPNQEAAEIGRATRAKERREDRAHHYAIVAANATEKTVSFERSYRVAGESRTVRERIAPASRVTGRELLAMCREAVRLGCHRLERKGMRISDDDRLDAVAELCSLLLSETDTATLPKRDRLGKTYLRERASGIVIDSLRKRQHEDLTDDFNIHTLTERAVSKVLDNAADAYLLTDDGEPVGGDPASQHLRAAARNIDPWPHSAVEAATLHATMPTVPSDQWAAHEKISASAWRSRVSKGLRQLADIEGTEPGTLHHAIRDADPITEDDQAERESAEMERLLCERPR